MALEDYSRPRNDSVLAAYETYLNKTAVELGADRAVAEQDARLVVDLEIELSKARTVVKIHTKRCVLE